MSNVISEQTKKSIYDKWLKVKDTEISKAQFARDNDISTRTLGRIIDKFSNGGEQQVVAPKVDKSDTDASDASDEPHVSVINWFGTKAAISMTLSNGDTVSVNNGSDNFKAVLEALMCGNFDAALKLASKKRLLQYTFGNIKVTQNEVTYKGRKLCMDVANFLATKLREGEESDVERLSKFLDRLMKNPSFRATQRLYAFLSHNDIKINDDGMIECWKRIKDDYTDVYTGTIDNSIGATPTVERNEVDEEPTNTCSNGLHLCAKSYLSSYSGERVVKCLLDPADVVAVPVDYNGAKLRACRYTVVEDVTEQFKASTL